MTVDDEDQVAELVRAGDVDALVALAEQWRADEQHVSRRACLTADPLTVMRWIAATNRRQGAEDAVGYLLANQDDDDA